MRRMVSGPVLTAPSEKNKVFCAQFVADELVCNDIERGTYCIRIIDTQHHIIYPDEIFVVSEDYDYHGSSFLDVNDYEVCLRFTYNPDIKTITFTMYAVGAIASSDYHIDVFKINI